MTNNKILELFNTLSGLKDLKGVKFNYAVARNISKLEPEVVALRKAIEMTPEYLDFDSKRVELAKKFSKKDDKGEPEVVNGGFVLEDTKGFNEAFTKLKDENPELVTTRETQMTEFNELLEKENPVEIFKIKMEQIPEEITTEQMNGIYDLIEQE